MRARQIQHKSHRRRAFVLGRVKAAFWGCLDSVWASGRQLEQSETRCTRRWFNSLLLTHLAGKPWSAGWRAWMRACLDLYKQPLGLLSQKKHCVSHNAGSLLGSAPSMGPLPAL